MEGKRAGGETPSGDQSPGTLCLRGGAGVPGTSVCAGIAAALVKLDVGAAEDLPGGVCGATAGGPLQTPQFKERLGHCTVD